MDTCGQGTVSEPPHIDMEARDPQMGVPLEDLSYSASVGLTDTAGRAPARVDSCPDMDTRPPLTPDITSMDMEAHMSRVTHSHAFHMQELLSELPNYQSSSVDTRPCHGSSCEADACLDDSSQWGRPCLLHIAVGKGLPHELEPLAPESCAEASSSRGLFMREGATQDTSHLFDCDEGALPAAGSSMPLARLEDTAEREQQWGQGEPPSSLPELTTEEPQCKPHPQPLPESEQQTLEMFQQRNSILEKVPGPCEPEDLLDGVVFGAKYLGSTQLQYERHQHATTRMQQAQEAVNRVKAPDGEYQPMTEVDVLVSTQCVKVLTADTQETLMDHTLQTISYTADIGSIVVIMARRKSPHSMDQPSSHKKQHKMLCHIFQSADAQLIAQAIGQAFGMAYQNFLLSEGVESEQLQRTRVTEQLYNADLAHFSKKDNLKEVYIQKQEGESLGVAFVESGWGSILPTVVIANLMHGGPAERSGELSIGDHVTSVNGTSLVGLPFSTCQGLIRELKSKSQVILSIVHCPPVVTAIIQRPDTSYQLGFCVEDGVISSLVRGGIAERGGIRVGHRIIEINGQSVVATAHAKIIQTLLEATGEVYIKTMPAATYRLLTGQETPVYI